MTRKEDEHALRGAIKRAVPSGMSDETRMRMRAHLTEYARMRPFPEALPARAHTSWTSLFHPLPVLALLLIVVVGGSTAGAAELALPGDTLYPVKVRVNEEVREALAFSLEAKANVALARAERRVDEIRALAERTLTPPETIVSATEALDAYVAVAEDRSLETREPARPGENSAQTAREKRLVALLRTHESLLGGESVGGTMTSEPTLEAVIAASAPPTTEDTLDVSVATGVADVTLMAVQAPEVARIATETPETPEMPETQKAAKNIPTSEAATTRGQTVETTNDTPPIEKTTLTKEQQKNLERQKKTAEQRVKALKKLVERAEKEKRESVTETVRLNLREAEATLARAEEALEADDTLGASLQFGNAISTALMTREVLLEERLREREQEDNNNEKSKNRGSSRDND